MHRRDLIRYGAATVAAALQPEVLSAAPAAKPAGSVEQWGLFEVSLPGPSAGNPYKDVTLTARFSLGHRTLQVTGFYDASQCQGIGTGI